MTEVTSLLKSLSMTEENEPRVKNCQIKRLRADEKSSVLLDGGATHCVRERRSIEEWERASSVRVQLASGENRTSAVRGHGYASIRSTSSKHHSGMQGNRIGIHSEMGSKWMPNRACGDGQVAGQDGSRLPYH